MHGTLVKLMHTHTNTVEVTTQGARLGGAEAVQGAVLHTHGQHPPARPALVHDQVQDEVLHCGRGPPRTPSAPLTVFALQRPQSAHQNLIGLPARPASERCRLGGREPSTPAHRAALRQCAVPGVRQGKCDKCQTKR